MSELVKKVQEHYGEYVINTKEFRGEHTVVLKNHALRPVMQYCRDHLNLEMLLDICSVDHEDIDPRFEMVYELSTVDDSQHLRIKVPVYPYHPLRKEFPLAGKPTEMPDVAFTGVAPMEGGPFVTSSSASDTVSAEPRAKGES